jgi:hypothetical protein
MRQDRLQKIWDEIDDWIKETDKIRDIAGMKNRKKLIKDLYVVKEGKETILSAGTMVWLFLGGNNDKGWTPTKKEINYPNRVMEEYKIRHRLDLFHIKTSKFDYEKIREHMK